MTVSLDDHQQQADFNEVIAIFIRAALKKAAPDAQEVISYGIPAFMMNKTYLVYFAGYKKHVSMYPVPKGDTLERKLPMRLISKIVKHSIQTNNERSKKKK
jgi:uncharacterized protein YdhG (YjbR/CyaY superfamily)